MPPDSNAAPQSPSSAAVSSVETSCIRGCCSSSRIPLNVWKTEVKIEAEIAQGAESVVYRGCYAGGQVAVKKPRLSTAEDMGRFHAELQILLGLDHSNISLPTAVRAHPPDYMVIFPLFERGNLSDAIHILEWKPTLAALLRIAADTAKALCYLHSCGILHRDVKPANILLDSQWGAHLSDFGLAEYASSVEHFTKSWKGTGKPTGGFHKKNMVGTLQYMAPEVLRKEIHTEKADVFSYAITINEICTGVFPYSDRLTDAQAHTVLEMDYSEQQLAAAITSENLRPVLSSSSPPELATLLEACWHSDPSQRPSFAVIVEELQRISQLYAAADCTSGVSSVKEQDRDRVCGEGVREYDWRGAGGVAGPSASAEGLSSLGGGVGVDVTGGYCPVVTSGVYETRGARDKMEDRFVRMHQLGQAEHAHLFCVFDGHRGYEAAEYAAAAVPQQLLRSLVNRSPEAALKDAFMETDSAFRAELEAQRGQRKGGGADWHPGCTAAAALVLGSRLFVANAGDCRTILCRNGQAVPLSKDHTAADGAERARIVAAGGTVQWRVDTWRVGKAAIQVTRSIGDGDLKPFVSAEPEVVEVQLTPEDEYLVMASDGLWDVVSNDEVLDFVRDTVKEPSMVAKRLATEAVTNRESGDNLTIIVVFLKPVSTCERIY